MKKLMLYLVAVLFVAASIFAGYYHYAGIDLQETVASQYQEAEPEKEEAGSTCPECAEKWRADAWRNENGVVSVDGLANAVAQRDAYLAAHNPPDGLGDKGIAKMNWLPKGPLNVGGRTRSLLIDPDDPRIIWAGATSGGVWKSTDGGDHWSAMNGGLQNFAVSCMAMDVHSPRLKTIYAGTGEDLTVGLTGGGLFYTTSVSSEWTRIESTFTNEWQYVDSLAITHWSDQTVILAGVSSPRPLQRGIMRSIDGGASWSPVYPAKTSLSIVVDPNNPGKVVAEVREPFTFPNYENNNRVIYSDDAGATWQTATRTDPTSTPTSTSTTTATKTPTSTATQTSTGTPAPTSTATATPEPITQVSPLPFKTNSAARIVKLAYAQSSPNVVYAHDGDESNPSQISRSEDGGHSYTTYQLTGIPGSSLTYGYGFGRYTSSFWVSPTDPNLIMTGGSLLWRSTNGGLGFSPISAYFDDPDNNNPHPDQQFSTSDPNDSNRVYVTTDGGIYWTDDIRGAPTPVWSRSNTNFQTTQFYSAAGTVGAGTVPGIMFGGAQDNGSLRVFDTNPNAAHLLGGDGLSAAVDGTYCYGELGALGAPSLYRFSNCDQLNPIGEQIWQGIYDYDYRAVDFPQIKVDQTNPNRFYFGGSSVWRSDNIRASNRLDVTWTQIKANPVFTATPTTTSTGTPSPTSTLTAEPTPISYKPVVISAMDVHPSNSNIVWVGERNPIQGWTGRLYYTTQALMRPTPPAQLPTPQWFRVDDNGSTPLPDRQILKILIDKYDPVPGNTVYVGFAGKSEDNLWRTTNGGSSWTQITGGSTNCDPIQSPRGLPCLPINAIAIDPNNRAKVYVGTDIGLFVAANALATNPNDVGWEPVTTGPANVKISDLSYLKNPRDANGIMTDSKILLAATYGRGLWTVDLSGARLNPKAINDFDGDGRSDLAVVREDGVHWRWHIQGSTDAYRSQQFAYKEDQTAPADYDGDGKTDLAVFRPTESRWYCLLSSSNTLAITDLGDENAKSVPADYDGDMLADKATWDPFTGTWEVQRSQNGNLTFQWGAPGDSPVAIDFDGDEKADFGVYHEENGMITLSYTINGEEFQKQFGLEGDVPVPGEYDGDQAIDMAVWRPDDDGEGNGCWYITYGTNGYQGVDAIPWGQVGDIPVPGDYDGDGKFDIAVWRPSDGMWHMLQSSNGYYSELFGADGDKPVGVKAVYAARPAGAGYTKAPSWAEPRRRVEKPKVSDNETQQAD